MNPYEFNEFMEKLNWKSKMKRTKSKFFPFRRKMDYLGFLLTEEILRTKMEKNGYVMRLILHQVRG